MEREGTEQCDFQYSITNVHPFTLQAWPEHTEGRWQRAGPGRTQELLDGKLDLIREIKLTLAARLHPPKRNKEAFERSQVSESLIA